MSEKNIKEVEVAETKKEANKEAEVAPMRQIVIETDGDKINLTKAEVSGRIELVGILQGLISFLNQPKS